MKYRSEKDQFSDTWHLRWLLPEIISISVECSRKSKCKINFNLLKVLVKSLQPTNQPISLTWKPQQIYKSNNLNRPSGFHMKRIWTLFLRKCNFKKLNPQKIWSAKLPNIPISYMIVSRNNQLGFNKSENGSFQTSTSLIFFFILSKRLSLKRDPTF